MASAAHNGRKNRESLSKRLGRIARQIKARDGHACVYCDIAWTVESPIFWTLARLVSWDDDAPDNDNDEARADAIRA